MNAPFTHCTEEPIVPGRVALVQFGVNNAEWSLIDRITARGAVVVRPMNATNLTWGLERKVAPGAVLEHLAADKVRLMQAEKRLPEIRA